MKTKTLLDLATIAICKTGYFSQLTTDFDPNDFLVEVIERYNELVAKYSENKSAQVVALQFYDKDDFLVAKDVLFDVALPNDPNYDDSAIINALNKDSISNCPEGYFIVIATYNGKTCKFMYQKGH